MIYVRSEPPEDLPVSRAELKAHLRREPDDTHEDALLDAYLAAAVDHLDGRGGILGCCLVDQEWLAYADFPVPIGSGRHERGFRLELGPIRTDLTVSVQYRRAGAWLYVDPDTFWIVQERGERASVVPAPGRSWPAADAVRNAWRITFRAGFGGPEHVPPAIRAAVLLLAADLYEDRGGKSAAGLVPNATVDRLLGPYSLVTV
jgi:uncharacterized phiE125 gp8 family phage protein